MTRILIILVAASMLGGCAAKGPASIAGGECKIFERPEYAVRGAKPYDQDWIDSQVEGGVGGCGWKRPAARPASIDGSSSLRHPPAPVKKRGLVQRVKDRFAPAKPDPVPHLAPAPESVKPEPAPQPRNRVDELLRPSEPRIVYPQ